MRFSHLGVIWWEVIRHVKYSEKEWTEVVLLLLCICKKENDREINEWYNEEKIRWQIGIYEQEVLIDQVEEILRCFKMRKIKIILCISSLIAIILSSCGKQGPNIDLASIDISDIDSVEHTGTTGGQNGGYSYSFSESESNGFIKLLNKVELGNVVNERDALSNGAVSYYTLYYTDGETLTISPGHYFKIGDTYYEFKNYDELWDKFVEFNSIH